MARFVWGHTGCTETNAPRVRVVRFGDGYEQRIAAGLNNQLRQWSVRFDRCDPRVAAAIVLFFRTRGGVEAFDWTNNRDEEVLVVCETWDPEDVRVRGVRYVNLNATFREVVA